MTGTTCCRPSIKCILEDGEAVFEFNLCCSSMEELAVLVSQTLALVRILGDSSLTWRGMWWFTIQMASRIRMSTLRIIVEWIYAGQSGSSASPRKSRFFAKQEKSLPQMELGWRRSGNNWIIIRCGLSTCKRKLFPDENGIKMNASTRSVMLSIHSIPGNLHGNQELAGV
ncbi:hypothetical protein Tco_1507912 [Tanacetum coccineum]